MLRKPARTQSPKPLGKATVYFGDIFGKKKQLEELKTKKIQTMRVWTSDSYVEKDFTTDNQDEFYNVINCLTKLP